MTNWQEKADEYKNYLKEADAWIGSDDCDWTSLTEGVKRIIIRGERAMKEDIEQYEQWAEEDANELEESK